MTRLLTNPLDRAHAEYGDTQLAPTGPAGAPIDMHRVLKTGDVPRGVDGGRLRGSILDVAQWLPFAAESYNISPDVRDYVLTPVSIFHTEIPNANLCAFPFEEMSAWNVQAGDLSYRTWKRKPTFLEHANSDHTVAKGVIFDASMRPAPEFAGDLHRVILLSAWDRNRDANTASRVAAGKAGFSMGSWVCSYRSSITGRDIHREGCPYFTNGQPNVATVDGKLVYRVARGVTGFELSQVATPAYRAAVADPIG